MRAVRASGHGGVAVVDVDATAPDHACDPVRVRVRSCGICGSDLHLAEWNIPVTLGHEFAGVLGKEAHLVPASMYGHAHGEREFDTAAALLASHPEIGDALVSHRFGLDDAAEAFRTSRDRASGAIKIVLEP